MVFKTTEFIQRKADEIKSSFAFPTGQHPVKDGILVKLGCTGVLRRAVRYAISSLHIVSLTGCPLRLEYISSTNILFLTEHCSFFESLLIFMNQSKAMKSRRDDILLPVDFNLRTENALSSLQSSAGTTQWEDKVSSLRDTLPLYDTFISYLFHIPYFTK